MNFLGIPLWERHVNGLQKSSTHGWTAQHVSSAEPAPPVSQKALPVLAHGTARLHILLFLTTVATTLVAGMWWAGVAAPMAHLEQLYRGIPYAGTLLA
ncbi:MAG TPA: hypothetical protein VI542_32220, partial [Candidatus Tectomicrobia bacterium]